MGLYLPRIKVKSRDEEYEVTPFWKCMQCNHPSVFREDCPNCHTDHHVKKIVIYG